jgi:phosphonate transport system substrate-binding protein
MLRCATWLSPGIPFGLFQAIADALAGRLGVETSLTSFTHASGPAPDDDPFERNDFDIGFLCAPSYLALTARKPASIVAVAAPLFDDDRNNGKPVYFAELVVRGHHDATSLADLRGTRIGYNDQRSMSGWTVLDDRLRAIGADESFATLVHTGGHRASLELLGDGSIDAASIDSNTLIDVGTLPDDVRVLETWGPFPVQPVVVRAAIDDLHRTEIARVLTSLHEDAAVAQRLRDHNVRCLVAVSDEDYR